MKSIIYIIAIVTFSTSAIFSADKKTTPQIKEMEALEGITHYGMPIKEISKQYKKNESVLEVVYSKMLSDDNMDDYVKRFYDELLHQIEKWLYENKLPSKDIRIVMSNCKFCKVGYCKRKKIREIRLVSYVNGKSSKQVFFTHMEIIEKDKHIDLARRAVIQFLDK